MCCGSAHHVNITNNEKNILNDDSAHHGACNCHRLRR